jgi:predicted ATPase/DNA-binding SARP family transcriptional activator
VEEGLRVELLGPVQVRLDGRVVALRSKPQRAVLARLAVEPDRPVSATALIDLLWPAEPPANASGNLHSYISKLRRVVGPDRITGEHGGYRLRVDEEAVDAGRAHRLSALAGSQPDPHQRAELLGEALSLWRAESLADLDDVLALEPERVRLSALRHELQLRRLAALVDAGDHATALPELEKACASDPHDEAVHRTLVRALHLLGRTSEALRTASRFRRRIAAETGLDATAELAELEQRILADDPDLRPPPEVAQARAAEREPAPATGSWPRFTTPLHGRDTELAQLEALAGAERIVTVTGPGGIGKTRLASTLAERRAGAGRGVHFFGLASMSTDDDLPAALAAALGLRAPAGRPPLAAARERLGDGEQLLVLDNAEHVLHAVRHLVDGLVDAATDLTVVTTSRSPLGLPAECVLRLQALGADHAAARDLFVERAHRVRPGWSAGEADDATIRTIIGGLGGLPLAIELAAGRMASMSLSDIAARIHELDLLADGRTTPRHRTVRATIDWSYRLLPPDARRLLCALSVFPAGVDLATAEEIAGSLDPPAAGATALVSLVEASLVDADLSGTARYTMLEPVRAYAEERLHESGEYDTVIGLRAAWAQRTAAWIDEVGRGAEEAAADARLRRELPNLRAAHRTARREDDLDTAIAISAALMRSATFRDLPELWAWALTVADHPAVVEHELAAVALGAAAEAAWLTGDLGRAERLAADGLALDAACVECLHALASIRLFQARPDSARELWMEASRSSGFYLGQAGLAAVYMGDLDGARGILAEADAWASRQGSPTDLAVSRYATGEMLGPDASAVAPYEDAIALAASVGSNFVASISRVGLASTLAANGEHRRAIDEFDAVIRYWRRTGNWTQQWTTLRNVAELLDTLGRSETAAQIRAAAAAAPSASVHEDGPTPAAEPGTGQRMPEVIVTAVLDELDAVRGEALGVWTPEHESAPPARY